VLSPSTEETAARTGSSLPEPQFSSTNLRRFIPLCIFAVTLAVCLINALAIPQATTTLIFDSQQYQWTTTQVGEVLRSITRFHPNFDSINNPIFHKMIMLDGPVLPVIHAGILACIGKVATPGQWQTLVWIESIFHALSAVVVYFICSTISMRGAIAWGCTALWALYPPAVIASARYLSENLTVLALLFLILGLAKCHQMLGRRLLFWSAAVGLTSALIVLLKPALAPGAAAALLLCIAASKGKRLKIVVPLAIASALIIIPWAAYTKAITGKVQITTQRYPAYNLAIGCNTEVRSWCTMPHDAFTELMQNDDAPFAPVVSQWTRKPAECAALIGEKVTRLYAHPWNDFRKTFLGVSAQAQYAAHWTVLLLGLAGLFTFVLNRKRFSTDQQYLAIALVLLGFSQGIYVLFEGVARYSFTVIPIVVLFSAFTLRQKILPVVAASAIVFGLWLSSTDTERVHSLPVGASATKTIDLSKTKIANGDALLLVDGDKGLDAARLLVNGHELPGRMLPIHYYDANLYEAVFYNHQLAWASDMPVDRIRTWRAIPVAANYLNAHGKNDIQVLAGAKTSIYADAQATRLMPAAQFVIPDKVCNNAFDLDPRVQAPIPCGNISQESFVSGAATGDSLRIRLAVTSANSPNTTTFIPTITKVGSPTIRINKQTWKSTASASYNIPIQHADGSTHLRIGLKGSLRSLNGPCKVSAMVSCKGTGVFTVPLWNNARALRATDSWTQFVIQDLFPIGSVKPTDVEVLLCPGEWQKTCFYGYSRDNTDAEFKDLELTITPESTVNATGKRIFFY
jgi:hypothetical protein